MKRFENPPAIEIELMDLDGKVQRLKAKSMTSKDIDSMTALINEFEKGGQIGSVANKQMAFIFGGKEEDYQKYDVRVIKAALEYFKQEMQNPLAG